VTAGPRNSVAPDPLDATFGRGVDLLEGVAGQVASSPLEVDQGGFNWSSQRLDSEGLRRGKEASSS
jgi:hypothetical protein